MVCPSNSILEFLSSEANHSYFSLFHLSLISGFTHSPIASRANAIYKLSVSHSISRYRSFTKNVLIKSQNCINRVRKDGDTDLCRRIKQDFLLSFYHLINVPIQYIMCLKMDCSHNMRDLRELYMLRLIHKRTTTSAISHQFHLQLHTT